MAIQVINRPIWWPRLYDSSPTPTNNANFEIDQADESCSSLVRAPATGNIAQIGFRVGTVLTGATITIGIFQVDSSSQPARPGSIWSASTSVTQAIVATTDNGKWFWVTLDSVAAVTAGEQFFVAMVNPTVSFGDMQFTFLTTRGWLLPYILEATADRTSEMLGGLIYDDGTAYEPYGMFIGGDTSGSAATTHLIVDSGTTPDTWGVRFKIPFPHAAQINGFEIYAEMDQAGTFYLVDADWDGTGGDALAEYVHVINIRGSTATSVISMWLSTQPTLQPDTWYRLVFVPAGTTDTECWYRVMPDADGFDAASERGEFHVTSAKDPTQDSDWTNFDNGVDGYQVPFMGLQFNGFDLISGSSFAVETNCPIVIAQPGAIGY